MRIAILGNVECEMHYMAKSMWYTWTSQLYVFAEHPIPKLLALIWKLFLFVSITAPQLYKDKQVWARIINFCDVNLNATVYKDILYSCVRSDSVHQFLNIRETQEWMQRSGVHLLVIGYIPIHFLSISNRFPNIGKWLMCVKRTVHIIKYGLFKKLFIPSSHSCQ